MFLKPNTTVYNTQTHKSKHTKTKEAPVKSLAPVRGSTVLKREEEEEKRSKLDWVEARQKGAWAWNGSKRRRSHIQALCEVLNSPCKQGDNLQRLLLAVSAVFLWWWRWNGIIFLLNKYGININTKNIF